MADRIWSRLIGRRDLRSRTAVQRVLHEGLGKFELALHLARHDPSVSQDDQRAVEDAVVEIFRDQELAINAQQQREQINSHGVQELLSLFGRGPKSFGNRFEGIDAGFIFTLNQDWLVERLSARNQHIFDTPIVPGVPVKTEGFGQSQTDFDVRDIRLVPDKRPERWPPTFRGNLNYIKLHGSFDWRSDDGRRVLVVGADKTTQIGDFPILTSSFKVFEQVLGVEGMRLMVIGYGFGDDHINAAIGRAVRENGLSIFVIDVRAVEQTHQVLLAKGDDGSAIFQGIVGFSHDPLTATFAPPAGTHRTVEYRRILEEFFELTLP